MKDQGFAVAPGTHTLVGIKKFKVNGMVFFFPAWVFIISLKSVHQKHLFQMESLPQPYGDCQHTVPLSECQTKCKTRQVVTKCGCHDVYMEPFKVGTGSKYIFLFAVCF